MTDVLPRLQGQYEPNMMWQELVDAKQHAANIQNHYKVYKQEVREKRPFALPREDLAAYRARIESVAAPLAVSSASVNG